MTASKMNIKSLSREELQARLIAMGHKKYRTDQILAWIFTHHAGAFEEMTNIAKAERELLSAAFFISRPSVVRT
jgi:23S rRNA (adenine2503-C2)-methyltransferase